MQGRAHSVAGTGAAERERGAAGSGGSGKIEVALLAGLSLLTQKFAAQPTDSRHNTVNCKGEWDGPGGAVM